MSKPAEKLKINRTRKRIYEMDHEDVPETEDLLQESVSVQAADVTAAVVVPDTVTTAVCGESVERELEEKSLEGTGCEVLQREAPATEEVQEPVAERELSAMEIAALEFAADVAAAKAAAAEASFGAHELDPEQREMEEPFRSAIATVYRYSALSAATGLIPVPLVDMAGFMAMQLMMLKKLCVLYNIPFDSQRSKSAIAILASGISSTYLAASSTKLVPFIGAFSIAAMPAVNGAFSYAVGRVFIQHFASGGTFLDFDPVKVRGYFEEQFRVGKLSRTEKS
ncbi:MAG: YcjF family protein [Desulfuromonadaceae bacterium]